MLVLVINSGSSSIKYKLFDLSTGESVRASGTVERIGIPGARLLHEIPETTEVVREAEIESHERGMGLVVSTLVDDDHGVISDVGAIDAVGHRVVQGGNTFSRAVPVDDAVKQQISRWASLAPLHNPPNLTGIEVCEELLADIPHVAVFDTAFHQTMPAHAYMYALPYEYFERYDLRRYGFHGTSHQYVAERLAAALDRPLTDLKVITCHLGNGASVTAIDRGESIDTSMGLTPLEGLVMGTRSGDLDPAAIPYLMEAEDLSPAEIDAVLNTESGLLGLSGVSSDLRDVERAATDGHRRAKLALEVFSYRVKKYIGAYVAAMNGVDALVFTAGIGEHGVRMRSRICRDLEYLGIRVDGERNEVRGEQREISPDDAAVRVFVIPTNEEVAIARQVQAVLTS